MEPDSYHLGSAFLYSDTEEFYINGLDSNRVRRRVQSSIETDVVRGYIHTTSYLDKLSPQLDGMMMEEIDDEETVVDDAFKSQRRPRSTLNFIV